MDGLQWTSRIAGQPAATAGRRHPADSYRYRCAWVRFKCRTSGSKKPGLAGPRGLRRGTVPMAHRALPTASFAALVLLLVALWCSSPAEAAIGATHGLGAMAGLLFAHLPAVVAMPSAGSTAGTAAAAVAASSLLSGAVAAAAGLEADRRSTIAIEEARELKRRRVAEPCILVGHQCCPACTERAGGDGLHYCTGVGNDIRFGSGRDITTQSISAAMAWGFVLGDRDGQELIDGQYNDYPLGSALPAERLKGHRVCRHARELTQEHTDAAVAAVKPIERIFRRRLTLRAEGRLGFNSRDFWLNSAEGSVIRLRQQRRQTADKSTTNRRLAERNHHGYQGWRRYMQQSDPVIVPFERITLSGSFLSAQPGPAWQCTASDLGGAPPAVATPAPRRMGSRNECADCDRTNTKKHKRRISKNTVDHVWRCGGCARTEQTAREAADTPAAVAQPPPPSAAASPPSTPSAAAAASRSETPRVSDPDDGGDSFDNVDPVQQRQYEEDERRRKKRRFEQGDTDPDCADDDLSVGDTVEFDDRAGRWAALTVDTCIEYFYSVVNDADSVTPAAVYEELVANVGQGWVHRYLGDRSVAEGRLSTAIDTCVSKRLAVLVKRVRGSTADLGKLLVKRKDRKPAYYCGQLVKGMVVTGAHRPHPHKDYKGKLLDGRVMADLVDEMSLDTSLRGCFVIRFDVDGDDEENWQRTPLVTKPAQRGRGGKTEACIAAVTTI
jgi:hypothetical protein